MKSISVLLSFLFLGLAETDVFAQDFSRLAQIGKRAEEIVAFLNEKPQGVGAPITDRRKWEALKESFDVAKMIRNAEQTMASPIPETPESLYMDYYQTGNRRRYEGVRSEKYRRFVTLTLAECFENQGRFLKAVEDNIRAVCDDPSWLCPAHDAGAEVYKGKRTYIDLGAATVSWELATADYWLQDRLSPEVRRLIRENVERRILAPYELTVKKGKQPGRDNGWITATNNWNAVCHAGVLGSALALIDDPARRAWFIASAEKQSEFFLSGFTKDGYCSEGMGYWNYGFGCYIHMGETVLQATDGNVNFFAPEIVRNISLFGPNMQIAPNIYAAFADCSPAARPGGMFLKYMNRKRTLGLPEYTDLRFLDRNGTNSLFVFGVMGFPNSVGSQETGTLKTAAALRHEFPDAGILIARAQGHDPKRLAFAIKAGHNAEHHNHNDVGSFIVTLGGATPLVDPGGEVYTSRTFSGKRYDSHVINSFGHSVPRVNGVLQSTGAQAKGVVTDKAFSDAEDRFVIDLASAYPVEGLQKLTRTALFNRTDRGRNGEIHVGGRLTLTDHLELTEAGTLETSLITFSPVKPVTQGNQAESFEILIGNDPQNTVHVTVTAKSGDTILPVKYEKTEINEDLSGSQVKPVRLAFSNGTAAKNVTFNAVITPMPAKPQTP
ncbi:MAG: heparinase II/III family protein [Planctomycetaceae bacterium]|jgi:hypothetical protein|nr:heparinase II/III family protein [Planctomycetaceae bacterium]